MRRFPAERLESRLLLAAQILQVGYFPTWNANPQVIRSTDPADVGFDPRSGHLYIVDSEIDELPAYYNGTSATNVDNIFELSVTGGTQYRAIKSHNIEPTGIVYSPFNGYWYVSSDDLGLIQRYDDRLDTPLAAVDPQTAVPGAIDSEAITVDPATGRLYIANGIDGGMQVLVYDANFQFLYSFPIGANGLLPDAEGIAFYPATGHIFVNGRTKIAEFTTTGTFIQGFDIASFTPLPRTPQGLVFAPSSSLYDDPSALSLYIADGGVDNYPDGGIYEAALSGLLPGNTPPLVSAGPNDILSSTLPAAVSLHGTASDDGLPTQPGHLSTYWTQVSGPAIAVFNDRTLLTPAVSLPATGSYVFRLVASDGESISTDEVTIDLNIHALDRRIAAGTDDAEEANTGTVTTSSLKLELVTNGTVVQTVGLRFPGMNIPAGATITNAYVQFETVTSKSEPTSLTIQGQAADNAATFANQSLSISSRPRTTASVAWSPAAWSVVGEAGANQRTPNLSAIIQQIVNRPGWSAGNALALLITGSGSRHAVPYETAAAGAPLLHIEFTFNYPPEVSAGPNQTAIVTTMATAVPLAGSVADDDLPLPTNLTSQWTKVSGPGMVTFANASNPSTTAVFSTPGQYVLRLSANDGEKSAFDDVMVTIALSSSVQTIDVRTITGDDDAEETYSPSHNVYVADAALDLGLNQVGLRYQSLNIPQGATITSAYLQFKADKTNNVATTVNIRAQAADNPPTFVATPNDLSARPTTAANVSWTIAPWVAGETAAAQRSPDIAAVVQEVVNRAGWAANNALAILFSGAGGGRAASSYQRSPATSPLLHIEYFVAATNNPPQVNAGPDLNPVLSNLASPIALSGSVTDDGQPAPPNLTQQWSKVSGPGTVTFANPAAASTSATFSAAGQYVLRLTGNDGLAAASDDVVVTVSVNAPPVVNAGVDKTAGGALPLAVALAGTASDDGLPNPPATLTTSWTQVSGPGTVTFANAANPATSATFPALGTYVLRLSASDTAATTTDDVVVTVTSAATTFEKRIAAGADDAEEPPTGSVDLASSDLEMSTDGSIVQTVGMRFTSIAIPRGVSITKAYIQFTTKDVRTGPSSLTIRGEAADNAATFTTTAGSVSARIKTVASAAWAPVAWSTVNEAGVNQRTSDLSAVIQEIVNRPGWASGNALALIVNGTGTRNAKSFEGGASTAPLLHIEYSSTPGNLAPVVNAGADRSVTIPNLATSVSLNGSATDDGLPSPPNLNSLWTKVSGPGTLTFGNAGSPSTTAVFSAAGTYVLRLTANDGAASAADDVSLTINVATNQPPTVNAGGDLTVSGSLPLSVALQGTASDDGLPNPPASLTTNWTQVSGPATVTFTNAANPTTAASFPAAGTYVLRLSASDTASTVTDNLTIVVSAAGTTIVEKRVTVSSDDAEERPSGAVALDSSDLEMSTDGSLVQVVGIRFPALAIPKNVTITKAYVQFVAKDVQTGASNLTIRGQAVDNAATFTTTANNVTTRTKTAASVAWSPVGWSVANEAGANQRTPDLSGIIQEIISRPGWASGNALAVIVNGTGTRNAVARDGASATAPLLHVEYVSSPPPMQSLAAALGTGITSPTLSDVQPAGPAITSIGSAEAVQPKPAKANSATLATVQQMATTNRQSLAALSILARRLKSVDVVFDKLGKS